MSSSIPVSSSSTSSHGSATRSMSSKSFSMFPLVEKTYRVKITEDIARDLRFLGQSRVDALTSDFDMTLLKDKGTCKLYELEENEFFTMKGVATVNAPLVDVMNMLKMDSTAKLREVMGEIFGTLFLDGVVLYKASESPSRMNEAMSVNWMALQSSKPHLPHRDYVFLRYTDVFEKTAEHSSSVYGSSGSGLYVGASVWESIELDGCAPMPASANVVRLRLRRCGIVVEEVNHEDGLQISLYVSEAHPGRAAVSSLTKAWMTKLVSCVTQIGNAMVAKALASQNLLSKKQFVKDGVSCYLCNKSFTLLRRKHHCRVCGDVVCSKCSDVKTLRQSGANNEIRVCRACESSSAASLRSSGSDSLSRTGRSVQNSGLPKPSISGYSVTSSDASNSTYDDDVHVNSMNGSRSHHVIHEDSVHSSLSDASSEPMGVKTYPSSVQLKRNTSHGPHDMIMLHENMASPPEGTSDLFYYNASKTAMVRNRTAKDRTESINSTASDASLSEFSMYTNNTHAIQGVTEDELAAMELASTITENTPFTYALSYSSRQAWPRAPLPPNEPERLRKVRELHLVDPGQHFQEMCEYAAAETGCSIASICFIGDKSGFLMAKVGVEKREAPRNVLLDAHTIMSTEPTIVLDATEDVRFLHNPLVAAGQVRFYAGFPLITTDGFVVGSFSVADPFARECLDGEKLFFLKNLADVAIRGVEQNTRSMSQQVVQSGGEQGGITVPPPPDMNYVDAHMRMQELLRTAYTTQCQVRMQVNPLGPK